MEYSNKIRANARFFTVLHRDNGKVAFIFVWDMLHWLRFDSQGKCNDIRYIGTGKTMQEAYQICERQLPGLQIKTKYCPRSFEY